MSSARPPVTGSDGCLLVMGESECRCVKDAPHLTDRQLVERATDEFVWQQRAAPAGRAAARRGLEAMLQCARAKGRSVLVAELLRLGIMLRILGDDLADADQVEVMLAEFSELAELDGDARRLGEAATMRAHRTIAFGHGENALTDAATALAILTDITTPDAGEDPQEWSRILSRTLNGLVLVLLKLGSHELADQVSQRPSPSPSSRVPRSNGSSTSSTGSGCSCHGRCGWNGVGGRRPPPPGSSGPPRPRTRLPCCGTPHWDASTPTPGPRPRSARSSVRPTRWPAPIPATSTCCSGCRTWRTSPRTASCWPSPPPGAS